MDHKKILSKKIETRKAVVGIIGIGYVGGALAKGASNAGFNVIGFTRNDDRARIINEQKIPNFTSTTASGNLSKCDIICICVPTPIHEDKSPDLEPLRNALQKTVEYLKPGSLIIVESTIAPGTTRNIALPILETSGLKQDEEFFLSFSPERVDPGNKKYTIFNTPKIVSGLTKDSCKLAQSFYESFVETVIPVSSLEAAEMTKILENTFRFVNISLANELLNYTNKLGINLWEVIDASATKPFGFLPHYPGPGIGGHCIAVDPYYLLDDAKKHGVSLKIIKSAGNVNDAQPKKVVDRTIEILNLTNGKKETHSVLLIGVTYKEDVDDKRESPSLKIWELLNQKNIRVSYHDPYVPRLNGFVSEELTKKAIQEKDVIVIATPHGIIDYQTLVSYKKPILDTKNILKNYSSLHVYRI